ncbi:NAD(P)H-dependent flavin oxidoreductase [Leifsonia aquatica]|uniref:Propionate 3-nitronate monooxygenase n=2 Tax=Leifsonia aquatica TaxID=144185 RepID=A0A7W4UV79_LEIAQ|nr:nitronate monooxygenase [Leifsonia aquatica]MBB2966944.1 nitronate monooxygenase [Leifsonia aquatica]
MRFEELVGVELPLVLGPFGGLSSVELTTAVSAAGGLGSFGLYGFTADRIRATAAALRSRTDRPFALNLWLPLELPGEHPVEREEYARYVEALGALFDAAGAERPAWPIALPPSFDEQIEAALAAAPAVLSFIFGVPPAEIVEAAHDRGIVVIGTATTVAEARALASGGVDAVVASGSESAGHRPSFLAPAEDSLVGGLALVPQVVDTVEVPVIAAGGIADRRGVAAAFALGADAVQVGTAFLATRQSAAPEAHRARIRTAEASDTVLTRAMSGRLARGLRNRAVREIEEGGTIAPFPVQNALTGVFRRTAGERGDDELLSLWMGQSAALARHDDAAEVLAELARGLPDRSR